MPLCSHCRMPFTVAKGKKTFCSKRCVRLSHEPTAEERFWRNTPKGDPDECWIWQGKIQRDGYGEVNRQHVRAHRFSYEMHHGPIPKGACVCHTCDLRTCVNPAHLFLGAPADNSADMARKGRAARGERNSAAKLTAEDIAAIRQAWANGETQTSIAKRYPVGQTMISEIVLRHCWRHLD